MAIATIRTCDYCGEPVGDSESMSEVAVVSVGTQASFVVRVAILGPLNMNRTVAAGQRPDLHARCVAAIVGNCRRLGPAGPSESAMEILEAIRGIDLGLWKEDKK